ncbi:MAG: HAD-IB family hydrolase [Acidimicrobiales bacterium]|nr:HAD-IB family hydrolase [Acidimicrobiales bacterium]
MGQAAFFDLDKTVIARASMAAFGAPFYKGGLISKTTVMRALYSQLVYKHLGASEQKLERIRKSVLELTRGWEQVKVRQIVEEALARTVDPILYREALDEIDAHQAAGRRVWLISASPEEIVRPLGRYVGVDGVIASRAAVDADGLYTGEMEQYVYGPYKAEAIIDIAKKEDLDLDECWAYSDSITDEPMLSVVGHPVAINPDRALAKLAKEKGWEIRHFDATVHLAERRGMLTKRRTAAITGVTAVTASGALAIGWWVGRHRRIVVEKAS